LAEVLAQAWHWRGPIDYALHTPAFIQRAASRFYVYFGPVTPDRFRAVEPVEERSTIPPSIGLGWGEGCVMSKDTDLLARIKTALVAATAAEQSVTTAQTELLSRICSTLMAWLRGEFSLGREFRTTRRV
jgi:hypothetical protein